MTWRRKTLLHVRRLALHTTLSRLASWRGHSEITSRCRPDTVENLLLNENASGGGQTASLKEETRAAGRSADAVRTARTVTRNRSCFAANLPTESSPGRRYMVSRNRRIPTSAHVIKARHCSIVSVIASLCFTRDGFHKGVFPCSL